jgi:hypothetical protein
LPSTKSEIGSVLNQAQTTFLMHGSVQRNPGDIMDRSFDPLPKECAMTHYGQPVEVSGISEASRRCKTDPTCKTFYFADNLEGNATSNQRAKAESECQQRARAECASDATCMWRPDNAWTTNIKGVLSYAQSDDTEKLRTAVLMEEVPEIAIGQNVAGKGIAAGTVVTNVRGKSVTLSDAFTSTAGTVLTFVDARGALCSDNRSDDKKTCEDVGGAWAGKCSNAALKSEAACKKASSTNVWTPATDRAGVCSAKNGEKLDQQSRSQCLEGGSCGIVPTRGMRYASKDDEDCEVTSNCPSDCKYRPTDSKCSKCCLGQCEPYVEFVGGRRRLRCMKCNERKGRAWLYNENAATKMRCVDPNSNKKEKYDTQEACEAAGKRWVNCLHGIDQPYLVTGDQLKCFGRVPRWVGMKTDAYPYAQDGLNLAKKAGVWGGSLLVVVLLVHLVFSLTPKLNTVLGLKK